jgi:uncharacterized integral membrane protein
MNLRSLSIVVVLALLIGFAAINWSAFTTPMQLSLLFATVQAPLGVIMLAVTAVLTLLFLLFVVTMQTSIMLESRRNARELQAQRELADRAEASRFTDLRTYLEKELASLRVAMEASATDVGARIGLAERTLRDEVEQSANSLSAYIGELEERLEQGRTAARP